MIVRNATVVMTPRKRPLTEDETGFLDRLLQAVEIAQRRGMTLKAIASHCGVEAQTLSRWRSGEYLPRSSNRGQAEKWIGEQIESQTAREDSHAELEIEGGGLIKLPDHFISLKDRALELVRDLRQGDDETRWEAIRELYQGRGRLASLVGPDTLRDATTDKHPEVRLWAAATLIDLGWGGADLVPILKAVLESPSPFLVEAAVAAEAAAKLGSEARPLLPVLEAVAKRRFTYGGMAPDTLVKNAKAAIRAIKEA